MDSLLKTAVGSLSGGSTENSNNNESSNQSSDSSSSSGLMGMVNKATSGSTSKDEDALGKGIDFVQEKFLGQGDQSKEGMVDEAQDEMIEGVIRSGYKSVTGSDFPVSNK